jgi:nicotinic acid mononucleotide adenylyltransferase
MDGAEIYYMANVSKEISSSGIRLQISKRQQPLTVDKQVLEYIMNHGLYQNEKIKH